MQDDLALTHSTSDPSSSSAVTLQQQPQRSLDRQVILEEDEYTAALSHIIARDFFPSLVHLDATNSYLDALRSRDESRIQASVRRLQGLDTPFDSSRGAGAGSSQQRPGPYQTPSQTPWAAGPSDTPLRTPLLNDEHDGPPQKRIRCDTDLGLDAFQARYTSEDNASFTQILDDENRRRRDRYGWAWDAQKRVEGQRVRMIEGRERLMIEQGSVPGVKEKLVIEPPEKPKGLLKEKGEEDTLDEDGGRAGEEDGKGREVVLASETQEQQESADIMAPKKDTRAAGVDGWNFKTRNAFMFAPDADVSPHVPQAVSASDTKTQPKTIKYANTRLPEQNEATSSRASEPPSPTRSRIDAAIAGTPYRPRSPSNNGFSLVPTMPSPTPSELGPAAVKQLMTWGTLNATPRIISDEDDESNLPLPSTPFHLPPPTPREQLGHKLSNGASRSLREKAALMSGGASSSSTGFGLGSRVTGSGSARGKMLPPSLTPGGTPKRSEAAGALTPAARRLLDRTTSLGGIGGGGVASSRRAEVMGRQAGWEGKSGAKSRDLNKVRWTPSPAIKRG